VPKQDKRDRESKSSRRPLPKAATGVHGLDEVLDGGYPTGRLTLIEGGPGAGKSLVGLEFLYRGALNGEPGILVSFEEPPAVVRQNAATLGWDLRALEADGKLTILEARIDGQAVKAGDFNLRGIMAIVDGHARKTGATRVVVDAPDVVLRLMENSTSERAELHEIHRWIRGSSFTALMTVKVNSGADVPLAYDFLDYMADCVVRLDHRVMNQVSTRRLRVVKYRGSGFGANEYPFTITENGIYLMPVSSAALRHRALGDPISTGNDKLDELLGGGYRQSSCTLISGTSGTGKTTAVCTFVCHACAQRRRVLYIDFEESEEAIVSGMLSPGIDLRPALKNGRLRFVSCMPEAMGVEEHLIRALRAIEEHEPEVVVVDAISACQRMGSDQASFEYLLRLIDHCKTHGITALLTNLTATNAPGDVITGIDLSSVIDTVILLRHVEVRGELNRTLLVLKSRGQNHSNRAREFRITHRGIDIVEPFAGAGGLVTGSQRHEREQEDASRRATVEAEIAAQRSAIAHKEALLEAEGRAAQAELDNARAQLRILEAGLNDPGTPESTRPATRRPRRKRGRAEG